MIKIGDFSSLAHVSIKTLHHYDDMGLLKPAFIDRFSGYRYYNPDQMAVLNRILALKDLGFSLEQVAQLLHENITPSEMRGMLRLKQMELATQVKEEKARLGRVEQRLRQIEQDGSLPGMEVALKQVPAQTALVTEMVPSKDGDPVRLRKNAQALLQNHLAQARLKPNGPWFTLVNPRPYPETESELTIGIGIQPQSGLRAGQWSGSPVRLLDLAAAPSMASAIHTGGDLSLPQTYSSLYNWIQVNGFQPATPFREIYLSESPAGSAALSPLDSGLIEVQCPVERVNVPAELASEDGSPLPPRIVCRPAFQAVGLSYIGRNEHNEITKMWGVYYQHCAEIKRISREDLGLFFDPMQKTSQPGWFEYVAATEVADDRHIPPGMVYRQVPAYKYAVFTHRGAYKDPEKIYLYIHHTALAQAGLKPHPDWFDMEIYDEDFRSESPERRFYIYVSIE